MKGQLWSLFRFLTSGILLCMPSFLLLLLNEHFKPHNWKSTFSFCSPSSPSWRKYLSILPHCLFLTILLTPHLSIDPWFHSSPYIISLILLFFIPPCPSPSCSPFAPRHVWSLDFESDRGLQELGAPPPGREMEERWKTLLFLSRVCGFLKGKLHLGVQPAARAVHTNTHLHTQSHNLLFITCSQNLIKPKISPIRVGRWQLFSPGLNAPPLWIAGKRNTRGLESNSRLVHSGCVPQVYR